MCDYVNKLKELTNKLAPLSSYIQNPGNVVEYNLPGGKVIGWGLLNIPEIAVQKVFGVAGSSLPNHLHEVEKEIIIVYRGHIRITTDDGVHDLKAGDCLTVPPGKVHSSYSETNVELIAITIPAEKGFPSDGR